MTSCGHGHDHARHGVPAQEMTKWFDTNYHYMVPELRKDQTFALASRKPIEEYQEAKALGYQTRPMLIGPVTFLKLAKASGAAFDPLSLLDRLLPVYIEVLRELAASGAEWVQLDEPCLVLDLDTTARDALRRTYAAFAEALPDLKIMLTTYFGGLGDNLNTAIALPVAGLHVDLVRSPQQIDESCKGAEGTGAVARRHRRPQYLEGRFARMLDRLEPVIALGGEACADRAVLFAASCADRSRPGDRSRSRPEGWLAFSVQKMSELATLGKALSGGRASSSDLRGSRAAPPRARRRPDPRRGGRNAHRRSARPAPPRQRVRRARHRPARALQPAALPDHDHRLVPADGRGPERARRARAAASSRDADYNGVSAGPDRPRPCTGRKRIGLDVLVHGEFERNDMVAVLRRAARGFAFTEHGWVQSYGSRCVRPPVHLRRRLRARPMTVELVALRAVADEAADEGHADRPGDDPATGRSCVTISRAARPAGRSRWRSATRSPTSKPPASGMIQIDEPALREGLAAAPRRVGRPISTGRSSASGSAPPASRDETQIHTHMCYSEFNDIIDAIAAMDADVISIETSRSKMELLDAFSELSLSERDRPRRLRHPFAARARDRAR